MFTLPQLPYEYNMLEPVIDAQTMLIHHTKHHQTYIDKLNAGLDGTWYQWLSLEELFQKIDMMELPLAKIVKNHGGWHYNHSFFWKIMTPGGDTHVSDQLHQAIKDHFWSLDQLKEQFITIASNHFGSGWAWLIDNGTTLEIISTPNQENPLMFGKKPLLGVDIREHAYYLKYQNRRGDYLNAWRNLINRSQVSDLYQQVS